MTAGGGGSLAFVEVSDLENAWRALTTTERTYAGQLLESAGKKIRDEYRDAIGAEIDDANPTARTVSIDMVRTAISTGSYAGHIVYNRGEGPRVKGGTLVNPGGALVFTDYHRDQLGIPIHALAIGTFDDCSDDRY